MSLLILASLSNIFFVTALKPVGFGAFIFFLLWLTAPYVLLAFFYQKEEITPRKKNIAIWLIVLGGLAMHIDMIFINPDAQGALGVLIVPVLQFIAIIICSQTYFKN